MPSPTQPGRHSGRPRVEGRPPREVAEALGVSIGTVYQYKSRVVIRIRREIEQFDTESNTHSI